MEFKLNSVDSFLLIKSVSVKSLKTLICPSFLRCTFVANPKNDFDKLNF